MWKIVLLFLLVYSSVWGFTPPGKAHVLVEDSFIESMIRLDASRAPCGILDDETCILNDRNLTLLYLKIYPDYVFLHDAEAFYLNKDIAQRLTLAGLHFRRFNELDEEQRIVLALLVRYPYMLNMRQTSLGLKGVKPQRLAQELAKSELIASVNVPWDKLDPWRLVYYLEALHREASIPLPTYTPLITEDEKSADCEELDFFQEDLNALPSDEIRKYTKKRICTYSKDIINYLRNNQQHQSDNGERERIILQEDLLQPFIAANAEIAFADLYYAQVFLAAQDRLVPYNNNNNNTNVNNSEEGQAIIQDDNNSLLRAKHLQLLAEMPLMDFSRPAEEVRNAYQPFIAECVRQERWDILMNLDITYDDTQKYSKVFEVARRQKHADFHPFGISYHYPDLQDYLKDMTGGVCESLVKELQEKSSIKDYILNVMMLAMDKEPRALLEAHLDGNLCIKGQSF